MRSKNIYQKSSFATAFVSGDLFNLDPIIVVGCPRSGTSVVARILQENLGVMMDEGPIKKDERNPKGYFEDRKLIAINEKVLNSWTLGTNTHKKIDKTWATDFALWVTSRASKYEKWGFKEPRMMGFIHWSLQFFQNPTFIWTIRTDEQIVKSQVEKFGYAPVIARRGIKAYKELIERYLGNLNLHRIDLSERKTEESIMDELKVILNGSC